MIKNQFIVPGAYVSPAVRWVEISARKSVMYTSPTGGGLDFGNDPGSIHGLDDQAEDYGDL